MANCVQCGRQLPGLTFGKKLCQWCVQHEAAQRGEDSPIQRVEAAPWKQSQSSSMIVTQAIIGINVIVFVAMAMAGVSLTDPTSAELIRWGANFGPLTISGQWWRLLSCVFLHIGIIHIGFNMWCLWGLGRLAESIYDHWTYAAIYLVTGVAASVASLAWNPAGISAGASGAIFGICGTLISSFYLGEFSLPKAAVSGLLRSVLMFAGYNLVFGAVSGRTDNAAHIGGLVSGLILGALIAKVAARPDDAMRRAGIIAMGLLLVYGGAAWLQRTHAFILHAKTAQSLLAENKPDQAIAELKSAILQRPSYLPARYELARAYFIKNDFANAEAELKRVLQIDPRALNAHYFLGIAYLQQKQPQLAQQTFSQLLKLSPNSLEGHFGLAEAFADQEKFTDALAEYKIVAKLDPSYDSLFQEMGGVQLQLKLYDDAIASFLQQQKNGDSPENENALADAYLGKGMQPEAAQAREKAKQFQAQK